MIVKAGSSSVKVAVGVNLPAVLEVAVVDGVTAGLVLEVEWAVAGLAEEATFSSATTSVTSASVWPATPPG